MIHVGTPLPAPPEPFPTLQEHAIRFWRFVVDNPQAAANYGTLISASAALVVALLTARQLRINQKALSIASEGIQQSRQAIEVSTEQATIARQALDASERRAREERLDSQAALISVATLPGFQFVLTDHDPIKGGISLGEQFDAEAENFDRSKKVRVSRNLPYTEIDEPDVFWLTGKVWIRNEGGSSAEITPFSWHWEKDSGGDIVELGSYSFLLPPHTAVVIRWVQVYSIFQWMEEATIAAEKKLSHPNNPKYNFKYLGVDEEATLLTVESSAVPDMRDYYQAAIHWLPLLDGSYASREDVGIYVFNKHEAGIYLRRKERQYPMTKEEIERFRRGLP